MTEVKSKAERVSTKAIKYVLSNLTDVEAMAEPSAEYPLAGKLHFRGIGWVTVRELRAELALRYERGEAR
jgi:hypothetical protein